MNCISRAGAIAALSLAAYTCALGCSSERDEPSAFPADDGLDEDAQLRELAVSDDEPIVDEVDPDEDGGPLEENPSAEDEEDAPGLAPLSNPPIQATASLRGRRYKCPGTYAGKCTCVGSPLNCEFPNDVQPGRDRYLPPSFLAEYAKRGARFDEVLEAGAWEATPGFQLYDGQGQARGLYKRPCSTFAKATGAALDKDASKVCVRVNFGQMKDMRLPGQARSQRFVYVLGGLADRVPASGWVPFDAIVQKAELAKMGAHAPRKVKSIASTSYVLKSAIDWKQEARTFVADRLPSWAQAGVGMGTTHVKPQAGDYLLRNGNVINLIYSTPGAGGASTDTFFVEHEKLAFQRVKSTKLRPALVRIPVADPKKKSMVFAYGSIAGRFGWIALDAIRRGTVSAEASGATSAGAPGDSTATYCRGKADGPHCGNAVDLYEGYAFVCKNGSLDNILKCPEPLTKCVSVGPDGSLICAP